MALHDEERRQLAEIERRLAEDDPRLARRLTTLRRFGRSRTGLTVFWILVALVIGLVLAAIGGELAVVAVAVAGVGFAVALPTVIIWWLWLRPRR